MWQDGLRLSLESGAGMIERWINVPKDCSDDDQFNDALASLKGEMTVKYGGKEVKVEVRAVRK